MTDTDTHVMRGCVPHPLLEPDDEWITTAEAARLLNSSASAFSSFRLRHALTNKSRSPHGRGPNGNGRLWRRADVELAAEIRHEARTGVAVAARLAQALIEGRIRHDESG